MLWRNRLEYAQHKKADKQIFVVKMHKFYAETVLLWYPTNEKVDMRLYPRMLRNFGRGSISTCFRNETKFETKWPTSKFFKKILKNFDRFLIEKDWNEFWKILIVGLRIAIDRNLYPKILIVGLRIKIFQKYFENFWELPKFRRAKRSKWLEIFSKNFEIGHFVLFHFENPTKWTPDRNFATHWP